MAKNGKNLINEKPKFGRKSLVTREEEKAIKEDKLIFSFLYFR
jgi:hypothetical protein